MKSPVETIPAGTSPPAPPLLPSIPPLESGDRLSRDEFERRYEAMPNHQKAELIEGVVYMPSPTRWRPHGIPHWSMSGWLWAYGNATPGVAGGSNTTLRLPLDNEPQPDVFLCVLPENGGQVREDAEGYVISAPDLVRGSVRQQRQL